ncbi:MaoC/PaaZ C-terminal domain-containing protein [Paracoccus siganidrum]|uniref:Dehydratase n=1 Tax=Paracoccus siganidrum TaxID=1276757 RepID=A0A419AAS2_9RHOB|nr:MaoC/PaaZ C-terminal domain-containing protein [Paracoccus siganidrum]RJL20220.1 dehydratase [Paracoccus siganidrum]RMC30770.1 dehydratase [Paracoccus siganidrum]
MSDRDAKPPRRWEDLVVGEETRSREMLVEEGPMIDFATRYDPQFFHMDPATADQSLFGGVIASGLYTACLWRILDHEVNGDIAWVCGVAWDNVRWSRAVRPGDRIVAHSRIEALRPSASRPAVGMATLRHALTNQDGETVFSFVSTDMVYRREG